MHNDEYKYLLSEKSTIERLLKQLPETSIIERISLESRKKQVDEILNRGCIKQ